MHCRRVCFHGDKPFDLREPLNFNHEALQLRLKLNQPRQCRNEVSERFCWQHDRVASASHILSDFEGTAAMIFFQVEEENRALGWV
jgi:hypothetical protein